jgi:hypothetical protein
LQRASWYPAFVWVVSLVVTKEVSAMSNVPGRKDFTTVETRFLEAGVELDLAAQAQTVDLAKEAAELEPRRRNVGGSLDRWGAVVAGAVGLLMLGAAALWDGSGTRVQPPALAVASMTAPASSPLSPPSSLPVAPAIGAGEPAELQVAAAHVDERPAPQRQVKAHTSKRSSRHRR